MSLRLRQTEGEFGKGFVWLGEGADIASHCMFGMFQVPHITTPFQGRIRSSLGGQGILNGPYRATAPIPRSNLQVPWRWSEVVRTVEVMALDVSHDAVVNDVKYASLVEHLEYVFMF
jgi:hypothetical protein